MGTLKTGTSSPSSTQVQGAQQPTTQFVTVSHMKREKKNSTKHATVLLEIQSH